MLSREENETLCRVGPGTPMGDLLRQYWHPALLSSELPGPDCPPLRLRLLGENLVAFRTTSGQVGLVGDNCPHRGASLFFGRNEEEGLRCVYHGWKFDVAGNCVDMPNEPAESNFKHKIHHTAYPCRERNGLIWAYMGPEQEPPDLPALEWNLVPENQRYISKRWQSCNWVQALEGGIDNSHASFLHAALEVNRAPALGSTEEDLIARQSMFEHRNPRFETLDTPYGVAIAARRPAGDDKYYYRITQFLMPYYSMIASNSPLNMIGGHAWVPVDDHNVITWSVDWHPNRPLNEKELAGIRSGAVIHAGPDQLRPATGAPDGAWRPIPDASNDWWNDPAAQKTERFAVVPYIWLQDQAVQESMSETGIYDRSREHLGSSDMGIIRVRRLWLTSAQKLREAGVTPPGVQNPESYLVRSAGVILPREVSWIEGARERLLARP